MGYYYFVLFKVLALPLFRSLYLWGVGVGGSDNLLSALPFKIQRRFHFSFNSMKEKLLIDHGYGLSLSPPPLPPNPIVGYQLGTQNYRKQRIYSHDSVSERQKRTISEYI